MSNSKSKDQRGVDRRRFLTTFALGAAAAPLVSLGRSAFARGGDGTQNASLCYSNKRILRESDLRYLGVMRVPNSGGVRMDFSYGPMTGRRVNGQVRLIMSGNVVMGDPVYEFADTGSYSTDPYQAPRMSLVRAWGDIYGSARKTWATSGAEKTGYPRYPGGMYWNEATQLLYWTYLDTYNVTGDDDWSLGATRLDPAGPVPFGPWRPAGGNKKGPWRCTRVTQHPSGEMLCGATIASGSSRSPWGPDLWAGNFPTASTPAGFGSPDLPIVKYITYYPMYGNVNTDGSFNGPLKACRRAGDYFFEPMSGVSPTQVDPTKNSGVGSWTELDRIGDAAWIDLPDVHGVLFSGKLASAHEWYSNYGVGHGPCSHGVPPPVAVTGPVSTDGYPILIIYDPADLDAVRSGARIDYTIDPTETINVQSKFGVKTAPITGVGSARTLVGIYFDAPSRKIYVAAPEADDTIGGVLNPLIHVFQIS